MCHIDYFKWKPSKDIFMPSFDVIEKRPIINIFKISGVYYFKHFFDDPELFRELEPFYDKSRYRFGMKTAGERNKVMKLLDMKGYDNSLDNYPLRDKMVFVMKDMAWVEQALAMGAVMSASMKKS